MHCSTLADRANTHQAFEIDRILQLLKPPRAETRFGWDSREQTLEHRARVDFEKALIACPSRSSVLTITLQKVMKQKTKELRARRIELRSAADLKVEGGNHKPLDHTRDELSMLFDV